METVIRLRLSELSSETILKVKKMVAAATSGGDPEVNIIVDLNDDSNAYFKKLNESIEQIERGEATSFTMEEFTEYVKSNFSEWGG